ncbi:FkbM family methyltransferase [Lyngbya aestuarii]|uniref:FkbM family methyltransferase n=1 Tax=Lyngbya aestuarii TaxID=118322 RepID=UPI00403DC050
MTSESIMNYGDVYWKYLEGVCPQLGQDTLLRIASTLKSTCWDNPTSAIEFNNCAALALIEAEQCQDLSLRGVYLEIAFEALNKGSELQGHPLCAAHLALVLAMTGEKEQALQMAFSTFINTLQPAYVNEQPIPLGLIYLPPANDFTDSRDEQLVHLLQTEDGYAQALLLFSEVLCRSQLVFYNTTGQRFLQLTAQLFPQVASINLKLGIANIINSQWEGLLNLHCAHKVHPTSAKVMQSLYLAYRDLGQTKVAESWLEIAREVRLKKPHSIDLDWTQLGSESSITYVSFEEKLTLAVESSLRSLVTSVLIAEGDWFEAEMEFWRSWLKPGMTVIDVGANVGVYTFSAAQRVGVNGCVLAVEPFSGCVRCLQETCRINELSWVKVCAGAASDRDGAVRLGLHAASELNEIVDSEAEVTAKQGNFEEVPCFTLDSLIELENICQVDLLKIDAEGHELQVLVGSDRILTEFNPIILYENIAGSKGSNIAVADFLQCRGYQLFRYQPYLQELIPINSIDDLRGRLNIVAIFKNETSTSKLSRQ